MPNSNESDRQLCPLFVFRPQTVSTVTAICYLRQTPNDSVVLGTDCGGLELWSLTTYRLRANIESHNNSRAIHLISFGNRFLSQHKNGVINVFNDQLMIEKSMDVSPISYCKCYVDSDSKWLSICSPLNNSAIDVIDLNSGETLTTVGIGKSDYGMCMTVCMTANVERKLLIIGYENGCLTLFGLSEATNCPQLMSELKCFDSLITCMDFDASINCGVCGSVGDLISVWRLNVAEDETKSVGLTLKRNVKLTNSGSMCCAIRPDARILVVGGSDCRIRVFAFKTLKALAVIDNHKQSVECVAFSHQLIEKNTTYLLLAASRDKTISVWSLYNQ